MVADYAKQLDQTKRNLISLVVLIGLVVSLLLQTSGALAAPTYLPKLIAFDIDQEHIYLLDESTTEQQNNTRYEYLLWRIHEPTQQRTLISDLRSTQEDAEQRQKITGMAWDPLHKQLIFAEQSSKRLFAIDPISRQRSVISSSNKGNGVAFGRIGAMVIDGVARRVILVDSAVNADESLRLLTQISLDTGDREALYSTREEILDAEGDYSLAFDPFTYQVFVSSRQQVIALQLASNEVMQISASESGASSDVLVQGADIAFDFKRHQLFVSDPLVKNLVAINAGTGERKRLPLGGSSNNNGLCWPEALMVIDDSIWIGDTGHAAWMRLGIETGELSRISPHITQRNSRCKAVVAEQNLQSTSRPDNLWSRLRTTWQSVRTKAIQTSAPLVSPTSLQDKFLRNLADFWQWVYVLSLLAFGLPIVLLIVVSSPVLALILDLYTVPVDERTNPLILILMIFAVLGIVLAFFGIVIGPASLIGLSAASVIATLSAIPYIPVAFILALLQ